MARGMAPHPARAGVTARWRARHLGFCTVGLQCGTIPRAKDPMDKYGQKRRIHSFLFFFFYLFH